MAIGIVTDDEFESELDSINASSTKNVVVDEDKATIFNNIIDITRGRGPKAETPESIRKIIADDKLNGSTAKELSDIYNVSQSSISAYAVGATSTSTYNNPEPELVKHVKSIRQRITKRASRVLNQSLNTITEESLSQIGPVKAAAIARDMSSIIKNMEDDNDDVETKTINNIVFYAPRLAKESEFEYLDVDDNGLINLPKP